jgi:signal transduction histidine kinase
LGGARGCSLSPPNDGDVLVSALAVPFTTLPLAWRRDLPLLPLAAITSALLIQAALGGFLVGQAVVPLAALVLALYAAGRHAAGARGLAGATGAVAVVVATRVAFDPAVRRPADAVLTLMAVTSALLVGRWVRGQVEFQRELDEKAERLRRERDRDARHAAEEERVRIATDLQAAVAGGLHEITRQAQELPDRLLAQDHAAARSILASIAATAREALADVRRILGILRRDGQAPRLTPPVADPFAGVDDDGASATASGPARRAGPDRATGVAGASEAGRRPPWSVSLAGHTEASRRRPWSFPLAGHSAASLDRLLVVALLVGAEIELVAVAPGDAHPIAALTAAAVVAPLLWRRARPVTVALAVLGAISVQSALLGLDSFPTFDIAAVTCAAYTIAAYAERRAAVAGLALAALGAAAHAAVFYPDGVIAALLGGVVFPWTVGRIVRGHRLLTRQRQEEAMGIERARAREARAAVTAERMRVARELHDAVAHNISVIAIQAAGAGGVVERDPDRAAQCAELIVAVGREALAELGRLAGLPSGAAADSPAPSLARVDGLARRARDAGLPVDLRIEGEPAAIPAGVDLAAYRIVQEALANASKHAGAQQAWVTVRYDADAIEVEIGDDGRGANGAQPAPSGGGHGLIGIRERVALYGGTLDVARRSGGGFLVCARLPLEDT